MATLHFTVATGPDAGKVFTITTLPAQQLELWAIRAFLLAAQVGVHVPDDLVGAGVASLGAADWNALAKAPWSELEPLLSAMTGCFGIAAPGRTSGAGRALKLADVADAGVLIALRVEWIRMHLPLLAALQPRALLAGVHGATGTMHPLDAARSVGNA